MLGITKQFTHMVGAISKHFFYVIMATSLGWGVAASADDGKADKPGKKEWSIDTATSESTPVTRVTFDTSEGTWISLDVSPDGTTIVFDLLGHLFEMPISGGHAKALTSGRSWNHLPRYSPDGREIAFTSDRDGIENIWVLNRESGELKNFTKSKVTVARGNWSADGRQIMASRLPKELTMHGMIYNRYGKGQEIMKSDVFRFATHFVDDAKRGYIYYEHANGRLPADGARIYRYNKGNGESEIFIKRAGGAFNPQLSPNNNQLAYMGRDDLKTALYTRNLITGADRMIKTGLDRDQSENPGPYGVGRGISWLSDKEIALSVGGGIIRINIDTGKETSIPFTVTVDREINNTLRVKNPIPDDRATTNIQRFASPVGKTILSEALGDLYLHDGDNTQNITNTEALESSPVYDPNSRKIYYTSWTDQGHGDIYRRSLKGGRAEKLTNLPRQYGALSLSRDGKVLAFLRGRDALSKVRQLEDQTDFELVVWTKKGGARKIADVNADWHRGNTPEIRRSSPIHISEDGKLVYFSEYTKEGLKLKRVGIDGRGEEILYHFPNSTRALISPDGKWIAFREYQRAFITPFEFFGKVQKISAEDKVGFSKRIDTREGGYMGWSRDSKSIYWTRGTDFYEKSLSDVLSDNKDGVTIRNIAVEYAVYKPKGLVAFTNARVITVDGERRVLEGATVVVADNKISAVGADVAIPANARVIDATGMTIMPGIVDAHGHYGGDQQSYLHRYEENNPGLISPLAHGVTTLYEVYGTAEKDAWYRDRLIAGYTDGPRLFTVGTPVFGVKYRKGLMRPISNLEDARQVVSYNKAFGADALKDYGQFSRRARHATIAAAREMDMQTVAETFANIQMNMTQIIDGVTGLEHSMGMTPLYDDVKNFMAASDVGVTPTLIVVYNGPTGEEYFHRTERVWENEKLLNFMSRDSLIWTRRPTHIRDDEHYAPKMAAELKKLYEAGVSLQLGAHGQMPGLDAHWEMELFQQGGFTPEAIIEIATINGASYHGFNEQLGSIEVGKLADMVIMSKNPLDDVRNARDIKWVVKNGVIYNGVDASRVHPSAAPKPEFYFKQ